MRRRASLNGDSLDLLLDTICNTFGGVLFIAILLIVLLQLSPAVTESTPRDQPSPGESESIDDLRLQLAELTESVKRQEQLLEQTVSPKLESALSEMSSRQKAASASLKQVGDLESRNKATEEELHRSDVAAAELQGRLVEAERQITELRTVLSTKKSETTEEIHSPVERSEFGKSEVGLVLRYGRFYVWHRYSPSGERLGLNTDDFLILDDTSDGIVVRPRPNRGIPIDRSEAARRAIAERLHEFNSNRKILAFIVRPDSYSEYRIVRDVAVSLGFQYRLMPCDSDSAVIDRGGRGGFVQ